MAEKTKREGMAKLGAVIFVVSMMGGCAAYLAESKIFVGVFLLALLAGAVMYFEGS